jgi:hypothetical protein
VMAHTLACYMLASMLGAWCAMAGGLASDGTVGPLIVTAGVWIVGTIFFCLYVLTGGA